MAVPASAELSPLPSAVWRWGHRLLWAGLAGGLGLTLVLAWLAPHLLPLVPLGLVGLVGAGFLFQRPLLNLTVVLFGFTIVLNPNPGVQLPELLYGLYYLAYLGHWYTRHLLISPVPVLRSIEDRTALFLLVAGVTLSLILAAALGHPLEYVRTDLQGFLMFAFYFPVKEACRRHKIAPYLVAGVVVWFGVFVATRNFLNFRQILLGATEVWHVADARPGFNELHLMVAPLILLVLTLVVRERRLQALSLALFLFTFAGLILTKSRSFWVSVALGVLTLYVLFERDRRRRMLVLMGAGVALCAGLVIVFFGDLAVVLFQGLINRFGTLQSAATQDMSLVNRFNEASALWVRIKANPWLGYGLGAPYDYYSWVYSATLRWTYIHIGYLGLWFKLGLWGMVGMLLFWARATWQGLRVYRNASASPLHRALGLAAVSALVAMTLTTITHNPFMTMDTMIVFAMLTGIAVGLRQHYASPPDNRPGDRPGDRAVDAEAGAG
jgi:O-antigen ligase